jgi:hypothetical protein
MFATFIIRIPPPSSLLHLDTTPNSHVCSIKTQHPQHRKLMFETSKTCRNSHAKSRLN